MGRRGHHSSRCVATAWPTLCTLACPPNRPLQMALSCCPAPLPAFQAERPARAVRPAALPPTPGANADEEEGWDLLPGAASGPLPRPCSRASAAAAQVIANPVVRPPACAACAAAGPACASPFLPAVPSVAGVTLQPGLAAFRCSLAGSSCGGTRCWSGSNKRRQRLGWSARCRARRGRPGAARR